jgi:hypothetical protein
MTRRDRTVIMRVTCSEADSHPTYQASTTRLVDAMPTAKLYTTPPGRSPGPRRRRFFPSATSDAEICLVACSGLSWL